MRHNWKVVEYGSEFPLEKNRGRPVEDRDGLVYLRSGRDALRHVAAALRADGVSVALLPCYCCESMEWPFLDEGLEVRYYRVAKSLLVDEGDLAEKARLASGCAVLYMNYYGVESISTERLAKLKERYSLVVIRDATHDWLDCSFAEVSHLDDYTIVSLRKWVGVPDGGLAFSASLNLSADVPADGRFESMRMKAMALKRRYLETGDSALKPQYLSELGECNRFLDSLHSTSGMGEESRAICGGIDWREVAAARRENSQLLADGLGRMGLWCSHKDGSAPLWVPFLPGCDRDKLQALMSEKGLYCPYLWPIPVQAVGCSDYVDDFVASMLCLPCDQRYDADDVAKMLEILSICLSEMTVS